MKPYMIDKVPDSTLDSLYNQALIVIDKARKTAYRQINEALVNRNWELGKLIVEEELKGENRAAYGTAIISGLSKRLTSTYGKGFTKTNLYSYAKFYEMFPTIFHSLSGKSTTDHLFASRYMLYLPTPEQLRAEIERQKAIYFFKEKDSNNGENI